jgi:putative inorganic carbon (hco3(-)) transporter
VKLAVIIVFANLYFICKGFVRPYYFLLGYVWMAFLYPQGFLDDPFRGLPFPPLLGILAILGYIFVDRRPLPRFTNVFLLLVLFAVWVTCTTYLWAEVPYAAAVKWNWAITSIGTSLIMPFLLRTRREIESTFLVVFFALSAHIGTAAAKALTGGGGYGVLATLIRDNSYLGESSTLATVTVMSLPLAMYVGLHSLCADAIPFRRISLMVYTLVAVAAIVGTSARTGLVALGAYVLLAVRSFWKKALLAASVVAIGYALLPYMPTWWTSRMQTIQTYETEISAASRLDVWQWTFEYVKTHPLGGGFDVYRINGLNPSATGPPSGRAFHNIYFETLGEQGFVGSGLYLLILGGVLIGSFRLAKNKDGADDWVPRAARTIFTTTAIFAVGGSFIGIASQPIGYALFGAYLSLRQFVTERAREKEQQAAQHESQACQV